MELLTDEDLVTKIDFNFNTAIVQQQISKFQACLVFVLEYINSYINLFALQIQMHLFLYGYRFLGLFYYCMKVSDSNISFRSCQLQLLRFLIITYIKG